ncbi:hypothetical protein NFI96_011957 [Prochilodus magdalenae]|nr:hypothetical protein NFI96_011957 [Prochilodus magdalenae]
MELAHVSALVLLALVVLAQGDPLKNSVVIRAGTSFESRSYTSMLTVANGEQFGQWTWPEMCPENFYAVGFSLRVESNQYGGDDTALNGIRLYCSQNEDRSFIYTVESNTGQHLASHGRLTMFGIRGELYTSGLNYHFNLSSLSFGDWTPSQWCPSGVLMSFQLRVEEHQGLFGDDTAVNNIRFRCSSNPVLEGQGMPWGEYGHWSAECTNGGICGIETKVEPYQVGLDDSSLNDVRFHCCSQEQ